MDTERTYFIKEKVGKKKEEQVKSINNTVKYLFAHSLRKKW